MGSFFIKTLISLLVGRVLQYLSMDDIIDFVLEAESQYENSFAKKGYVYRVIKGMEPEEISQTAINLAIEAVVYYVKKVM